MSILIRTLYEFKDDTFEVFSFDEVLEILESIKEYSKFNLIIYKTGFEPNFKGLVLSKNYSEFSIEYFDNFNENFDNLKISSILEFNLHLKRFLNEEEEDRTKIFFESLTFKNKEKEKQKHEKWKVKYKKQQEFEKKRRNIKILIVVGLLPFVFYLGRLFYTGEYKFLGQDTSNVKAVIFKTNWFPNIGGNYQRLYFEYEYNEKKYDNIVIIGKRIGKKKVGDIIHLKISNTNPKTYIIKGYRNSSIN